MRIKEAKPRSPVIKRLFSKPRSRRLLWLLAVLLVFGLIGGIYASRFVKGKGYSGLWNFTSTVVPNYFKSFSADPENIAIDIKQEDFQKLAYKREQAIQRGLIINEDDSYVPASIRYKDKTIKIKLRLKGHMTDHIAGEKWSFRVNVRGNDQFMGMRLFSLQHPGTRGYVYEWIYHQLQQREDIIALRYAFVKVSLNGKDLGIYAVEENFDQELIENNKRKKGPVMRFNPDLYWVDRYNEILRDKPVAEYAAFQSANLEPYREGKIMSDTLMRRYYLEALGLMEGFRRGKLRASEVFDIPRLAKFHAIIDLVGGHHSLDWSDIKYYYNSITARLEPVAYESFTVFPSKQLSGSYRFIEMDSTALIDNYHIALFSDPVFFSAYIHELERISTPAYLDSFFTSVNVPLEENLAILYKEFPYKRFEKEQYYKNQGSIRKMLDTPKGFHAYYSGRSGDTLSLVLGAIESLPLHIKGLSSAGRKIASPVGEVVLPSKGPRTYVKYRNVSFVLLPGKQWHDSLLQALRVDYSVLGASAQKKAEIFPYPYTIKHSVINIPVHKPSNVNAFPFFRINDSLKEIMIVPGKWKITEDVIIPAGYTVKASSGVELDMRSEASILSYSPVEFDGTEDVPVMIGSSDGTGEGIFVLNAGKISKLHQVVFRNLGAVAGEGWKNTGVVSFYESPLKITECQFHSGRGEDQLNIIRSEFTIKGCLFRDMQNDAIDIDFSDGSITNVAFEECKENALDITMGNVTLDDIYVNGAGDKALNAKTGSQVKGRNIRITNSSTAVAAEDLADVNIEKLSVTKATHALVAFTNKPGGGPASITVSGFGMKDVKKDFLVEKRSSITVNGKKITDKVKNVEKKI